MFPFWEHLLYLEVLMRLISTHTLREYWTIYLKAEQPLKAWVQEVQTAQWDSPKALKMQCRSAAVLADKRVLFNISDNKFRLVADVEYQLKIVLIVWFGPHAA